MRDDYILFDNKDDLITRYVVSECSCVLEDTDDLHAGCVLDKAKTLTEEVKGVFREPAEAGDFHRLYKTIVKEFDRNGVPEFEVRECYIFERQFNIERAMQENKDIISEDDFDNLLQTDYLRIGNYVVDDTDMKTLMVSPMHIFIKLRKTEDNSEPVKYISFEKYSDAKQFEKHFDVIKGWDNIDLDNWETNIIFNDFYSPCYNEAEVDQWLEDIDESGLIARKHLFSKLQSNLSSYKEELEDSTPKGIIERSYETVMKEELICLFYPDEERYDINAIKQLCGYDNPLDILYRKWLDVDVNINELLEDTVQEMSEEFVNLKNAQSKYDFRENLKNYSDEELAYEIREVAKVGGIEPELTEELIKRADLVEEWNDADAENGENIIKRAAAVLNVFDLIYDKEAKDNVKVKL